MSSHRRCGRCKGFTLVELLVVLGIIALLIALLLPTLSRAREQAKWVTCQSNMRQVGAAMLIYANNWNGWVFPPLRHGGLPVSERWPVFVFKLHPPEGSTAVEDWTPAVLTCPSDFEPREAHTYVLNDHLYLRKIRYHTRVPGVSSSEIIVMGEKRSTEGDYFMNVGDFDRVVEPYRHGFRLGSNYLFLDMHVGTLSQVEASGGIDPWDVPEAEETQ